MSNDLFTCVTCHIGFNDHELQRDHYKTDWHRYNLKRKVADMPPVTFQDFSERAKLQKDQEESVKGPEEMFCKVCSKHFTNENSFANHKQSKKHKDLEFAYISAIQKRDNDTNSPKTQNIINQLLNVKSDHTEKKVIQMNEYLKKLEKENAEIEAADVMEEDDGDLNWEDVGDDEMDIGQFDDSQGIPLNDCFFCDDKFNCVEDKCEHMAKVHSFYIPDMTHVSDLSGLVKFLGIKIGVYHVCLWCSTKCYRDIKSVSRHMSDKGHQKMRFEGETLLEYADFYSFDGDSTVEEEFEILDESSFMNTSENSMVLYSRDGKSNIIKENTSDFELVLPSGTRLGHRSLQRYYKQSFGHRNLENKALCNITLRDKYLAISMGNNYTAAETKKSSKDMAYFQRYSQKWKSELGSRNNKLQKHFRRQDICF